MEKALFYSGTYPLDHWAWSMGGDYLVGTWNSCHIKLNPTDSRGLRLIVCLGDDEKTIGSTWNRPFTAEERKKVFAVALEVEQWLRTELMLPEVQIIQAGNNAHSLTKEGEFALGSQREPLMLHVHLIARGVIGKEYLSGVKLTGPVAGEIFDLRGTGKEEFGQQKKKWDATERLLFQAWLAKRLKLSKDRKLV